MQTDRNKPLSFAGYQIPVHTEQTLQNLWLHNIPPGGFVSKMIRGDWEYARAKADASNLAAFDEIYDFIVYEIPNSVIMKWIENKLLE